MVQTENCTVQSCRFRGVGRLLRTTIIFLGLAVAATGAFAFPYTSKVATFSTTQPVPYVTRLNSRKLIAPSAAARIAMRVAPASKLLDVRLSGGGNPRYVVKTRSKGRLRTIVIDAKTGTVMRR